MRSFLYDGATELVTTSPISSFSFTQSAYRGEVGDGGFDFDDLASASDIVGLKPFVMEESDSSPSRVLTAYIADRTLGRGPSNAVDGNRQWGVNVVDENTFLDDILLRNSDSPNRPAETVSARVAWLMTTAAMAGVSDAGVLTTSTVMMDAADYTRQHPRDVLDQCAEISGDNFYLRDDGAGSVAWFYDSTSSSIDLAAGSISNVLSEISDPDSLGATIFAPAWKEEPVLNRDPSRVYSEVSVGYDSGASVGVNNGTTESTFRRREIAVDDSAALTASVATAFGNQYLAQASTEEDTLECPLNLPSTKLGLYRPGQRVNTNFTHLGGSKAYRISRITWEPWEDSPNRYLVTLTLVVPVKITRFSGRGSLSSPSTTPFVPTELDDMMSFWQFDPFEDGPVQPHGYIRLDDIPEGVANLGYAGPIDLALYPSLIGRGWELRTLLIDVGAYISTYRDRLWLTLKNPIDGPVSFNGAIVTDSITPPDPPTIRVLGPPFTYADGIGTPIGSWPWTDPSQITFEAGWFYEGTLIAEVTFEVDPAYIDITGFDYGSSFGYTNSYQWNLSASTTLSLPKQIILESGLVADHDLAIYAQLLTGVLGSSPISGQPVALAVVATGDSTTDGFTTAYPYKPGSLVVLVDRIDWSNELAASDPASGDFTLTVPPQDGDIIEVRYIAA